MSRYSSPAGAVGWNVSSVQRATATVEAAPRPRGRTHLEGHVARIVFDPAEAAGLRDAAHSEFPGNPALAFVLEQLASEGIDLDTCRSWDDIRAERGLPPLDEQDDVA